MKMLNKWVVDKLNANNMSMRELGRKIDIAQSQISRILSEKQDAKLDFYLSVAQVFDAVPEVLRLAGILPKHEEDNLTFTELYELGKRLSPAERKELLDYADYLLQKQRRSGSGENTGESDPAPATA